MERTDQRQKEAGGHAPSASMSAPQPKDIDFDGNAAVEMLDLRVAYGEKRILAGFSMRVMSGEKICLSGPSGAGKTTLLNLIMGFVYPEQGDVQVMGRPLRPDTARWVRAQTAWIPQDIHVPAQTASDFLLLPFHFRTNKHLLPAQDNIRQMLTLLDLEPSLLSQPLVSVSGGQRQRLAIASALLLQKRILLMDEPTSALDAHSAQLAANAVRAIDDLTVISVSHDPNWAGVMDRVVDVPANHQSQ